MIIDDEGPSSPTKQDQPQALPTTRREVPEDAPPPAYTGPSTSYLAPVHDAHAGPSSPLLDSEAQLPKEEPAGRRFFKAFAIALAIWFTVAIISGGTIRSTYLTIRERVVSILRVSCVWCAHCVFLLTAYSSYMPYGLRRLLDTFMRASLYPKGGLPIYNQRMGKSLNVIQEGSVGHKLPARLTRCPSRWPCHRRRSISSPVVAIQRGA